MSLESKFVLNKVIFYFSGLLLRNFERKTYHLFTKVHVVSPIDKKYLNNLNKAADINVIPITIENSFINYKPTLEEDNQEGHKLVFIGALDVAGIKNGLLDFLKNCWDDILKVYPNTRLSILGRNTSSSLKKRLESYHNVTHTSWVQDYVGFLASADIVVSPDKVGTGMKNRTIQAMALSKPVVGSAIVFEGIEVENGISGIICNQFSDYKNKIIELLNDVKARQKIGNAARKMIIQHYTDDKVGGMWINLYIEAIKKHKINNF
jgi:glycosyltransferase involved in cell wall biosynthesis